MVKFFKTPFANNGDKLNIPEELQEDGSISFDQGYGEDYEKNRKTDPDAKNISRQSFNGLLHDITDAIGDIQRSGVAKWSDEVTYSKGSLVWHNKSLYSSLLDSNKSQPPSASWTTLLTEKSLDLTEYRKLDNNVFNGYLQIRSENEDQETGVFLQDTDGTIRGQVVATYQGLQLTQSPEGGTSQTFTFPSEGEGGEILTDRALLESTPVGIIQAYIGENAPNDKWLLCRGQAFSAESYPVLAQLLPDLKIPDLRGVALRGLDANRGFDPSRELLSYQEDAMQKITGSVRGSMSAADDIAFFKNPSGSLIAEQLTNRRISLSSLETNNAGEVYQRLTLDSSLTTRTANETRIKNVAVNFIIKAR